MRIGTRGSALALWQAQWVSSLLARDGLNSELVQITTSGDRGEGLTDKARWTTELELALLEGRIDVAVHSAKDVPGEIAEATVLAAVPAREDPRDVLCGAASLAELQPGARVGTSSLRRAAQLLAVRADLEIVPIRGNVDTRLRKLADGEVDVLVLALAGLRRLEREDQIGTVLDSLVPAAGQGALILQTRVDEELMLATVHDRAAAVAVRSERELTLALGASCDSAVGALATHLSPERQPLPHGHLHLCAWVGLPDGSHWIADSLTGPQEHVAARLAERLITVGARELIAGAGR